MKSGIRRVLLLLAGCAVLAAMTVTLDTAATTGHEGTTRVIARIVPHSSEQSVTSAPESSTEVSFPDSSSTDSPSPDTGSSFPTIPFLTAITALLAAAAVSKGSTGQEASLPPSNG